MNMTEAVRTVFNNYATFTGRAARPEYWWWVLFSVVVSLVLGLLDSLLFHSQMGRGVGILGGIFSLATLIPSLAVSVRRMHDVARSGWWLLIVLVPIIGALVLLYWFVQRGTVGPNDYGQDPTI